VSAPSLSVEKKVIKFDGGGIFFWYQAGVCKYMQEQGFLHHNPNLSVLGTSAGALSGALLLCDCNFDDAAALAIQQSEREHLFERPAGLMFKWGAIIEDWLEVLLPERLDNASNDEKVAKQMARLLITATAVHTLLPWKKNEQTFLTGFTHKSDLIAACMSSVHIPLFLDKKLYTKYYRSSREGKRYDRFIDGSFWPFFGKASTAIPRSLLLRPAGKKEEEEEEGNYVTSDEIYVCGDWQADAEFAAKIQGAAGEESDEAIGFVSLVTPAGLYQMMAAGYAFMQREHLEGRVPPEVLPQAKPPPAAVAEGREGMAPSQ
jgi:hypothetical protein